MAQQRPRLPAHTQQQAHCCKQGGGAEEGAPQRSLDARGARLAQEARENAQLLPPQRRPAL